MKRVFLGGTCNDSKWREQLIPMLKIDFTLNIEKESDFYLYIITPRAFLTHLAGDGLVDIAMVVQISSANDTFETLFCILYEDGEHKYSADIVQALRRILHIIEANGAKVFDNLEEIADYLNQSYIEIPYNPNLIECLIERDGPTEMNLHKATYLFEKNELGDYVCEVLSGDHRKHLLSLPDFRIYQEDKAPKKDFTDEEDSFMREWKLLSDDVFLAYVNGHIAKFNDSSSKIRAIAAEKWQALLSHMDCPICVDDIDEFIEEVPQGTQDHLPSLERNNPDPASNEDELTVFDREAWKKWKNLNGNAFKNYVEENEQQFLDAPEFLWDKAMAKWQKLITDKTGEIWPFDESDN